MIREIRGNALQTDAMVIGQGTNCIGAMGKGFAKAISDTWPHVDREFKRLHRSMPRIPGTRPNTTIAPSLLGTVQFVGVTELGLRRRLRPNLAAVANLFIQLEVGENRMRVEYDAVRTSLTSARDQMLSGIALDPSRPDVVTYPTSLSLPRIGTGLAGGEWSKIRSIIDEVFGSTSIDVTIYVQ
jgi:O-acetyl-ADP-ribose deacetylase (regulator of RNase III)